MGEWRQLTPGEAVARGLMPPGPLGPLPSKDPVKNEQAMREKVNPEPLKPGTPEYAAWEERVKQGFGLDERGGIPTRNILGALVPSVVGALPIGGMGRLGRFGINLAGNVLGQGVAGAAGEYIDKPEGKRDIPGAALEGAREGVVPGLLQGAFGAILGPNKATLRTQKQIGAVRGAVSPEVASVMDKTKPANFLKSETPIKMGREAGTLLDKMEAEVEKKLSGKLFSEQAPSGKLYPKGYLTFTEMRDKIKELREQASLTYDNNPMSKKTSRDLLQQAKQLEEAMVMQMPPDVAKVYKEGTATHRANMDAVRFVRGVQKAKQIEGGVNPYDRPGLGEASRQGAGKTGSQMAHGALGAVEAVTGRPWGAAYNLSRAAGSKGAPKVAESVRGPLASRVPGIAAGTGALLGQDYVSRSTGD